MTEFTRTLMEMLLVAFLTLLGVLCLAFGWGSEGVGGMLAVGPATAYACLRFLGAISRS